MNATSRYFRKLFSGSRELNYGNTVLVQRDNGQWWLGFVQDIDGPNFFVDFDASSISAHWIHSSRLWSHHFSGGVCMDSSVQIALRRTHADPMVFWPGIVVEHRIGPFFSVRLTGHIPDGMRDRHIVHRNHCTKKLPMPENKKRFFGSAVGFLYRKLLMPEDDKSFFERTAGFVYRKHVLRFPKAHALPDVDFIPHLLARTCRWVLPRSNTVCDENCPFDRHVSVDEMRYYCNSDHKTQYTIGVGCRMFVRVGLNEITFICAEMKDYEDPFSRGNTSIFWDEQSLRYACDGYFTLTRMPNRVDTTAQQALENGIGEISISDLTHPIIAVVLFNLDVDSQFRTSRVCALWSLISRESINHRHILFDLCTNCDRQPEDLPERHANDVVDTSVRGEYEEYLAYKLVAALDRAISAQTQTLALRDDGDHCHEFDLASRMKTTAAVLASKGVRLRKIMLKNAALGSRSHFLEVDRFFDSFDDANKLIECDGLSEVMAVCEQLVLVNCTFSHFIRRTVMKLVGRAIPRLPDSEVELMRWNEPDIDPNPITVPCLRFLSVETATQYADIRIILAAINDHCPVVSQRVFEKVKAIYARWVETVPYENDRWDSIDIFLYLFNYLRPGDAPKDWDTMDLRQLDVATWTPITFAALDECYKDQLE
ncbi:uncharacterized protein LOC129600293 [Paramacrobiotus metropolitanus]|uniref:uncharacterized protein LOC129600293 n=1 Tax=Paramacrobiotus metropolitanus TaxID=2943436 RepID=UPI00244581AB|nr:uncharacterized protein LOC129600293 [Paramacrobiotus metropolitanus]